MLVASSLVCCVLGSIHAFSVFLTPLEQGFELSRATASLTYSFGLLMLTVAVLMGPKIYTSMPPVTIYLSVGLLGTLGSMLAGSAQSIVWVWLGYSVLFGAANGLGYGFSLQFSARANPSRPGFAMGVVTAAYALGAVVSPLIFANALERGGFPAAMTLLAASITIASGIAAWVIWASAAKYGQITQRISGLHPSPAKVTKIWISYGSGVATGLMAIGHATGIADGLGITPWIAPAIIAASNMIGSLVGGSLIDRLSHRTVLATLPILSVVALVALLFFPVWALLALSVLGFAYGALISAYPASISARFPGDMGPRVYGLVFTAWGLAGLVAPWLAGVVYDRSQNYDTSLWIALALALISAGVAWRST